jgi:uroporphyrin-III C-methyltransferase
MAGKVHIVGAGPGAADLLTIRAVALLGRADIVLHDDLVPGEILQLVSQSAQVVNVGKRCGTRATTQEMINAVMIWHADNGSQVVRLKSGDPAVFGRLGEEADALRRAGVSFEVVPGITAASAAAAAAGITLTDRRSASTLVIGTGHNCREQLASLRSSHDPGRTTLAVYMPGPDYGRTATQLLQSGLDGNTPCVLVSQAARANQHICYMTISDLHFAIGIKAPAVLIVGEVAQERRNKIDFPAIINFMEESHDPVGNGEEYPTH